MEDDSRWYLAYCIRTPVLEDRIPGEVRLIGILPESGIGLEPFDEYEHPTRCAFWPPIDLMSPRKRAQWFKQRLEDACPKAIQSLDTMHSRWRNDLQKRLDDVPSAFDRLLEYERFNNLNEAVGHIAELDGAFWNDLLARPQYVGLLERKRAEIIESESAELKREAVNQVEGLRLELEKGHAALKKKADSEIGQLQSKLEFMRTSLETEEATLQAVRKEIDSSEERLTSAAALLDEATARVVAEYYAFQTIAGRRPQQQSSVATLAIESMQDVGHAQTSRQCAPCGEPILESLEFVQEALAPALDRWLVPAPSLGRSKLFHAAILSCRGVIVPSVRWARAYADAMGGTARLNVVACSPVWLSAEDVWPSVRDSWEEALVNQDILFLIAFQDVNRTLFQCWAKPWLNALAGLTNGVEFGGRTVAWPRNVRLFATEAEDDAVQPVPPGELQDWAVIDQPVDGEAEDRCVPTCGHVPLERWFGWSPFDGAKTGPRVGIELDNMSRALELLGFDDGDRVARKVRLGDQET